MRPLPFLAALLWAHGAYAQEPGTPSDVNTVSVGDDPVLETEDETPEAPPTPPPSVQAPEDPGTEGEAAPSNEAEAEAPTPDEDEEDGPQLEWLPGIESFGVYRLRRAREDGSRRTAHVFELERTMVWLGARYGDLRARIMLESVPSGDEAGLLAVGGDSLVIRVREAWASYNIAGWVQVQAGMIPTLTQPLVERSERLRPIGKGPHERFNLLFPADVGASVSVRLAGYGRAGAGVYNGESYRSRELNRGKTTELFIELRPLAFLDGGEALRVAGSYILGSEGAGSARADRITGLIAWSTPALRIGASFTYALGFEENGAREGWLAHGFARVEPYRGLILGARAFHFRRSDEDGDTLTTLEGTVGYRILEPLEVYAAVERDIAGARAEAAIPGSDAWEFSLTVRMALGSPRSGTEP